MIFDFSCFQISSLWDRLIGAIGDAAGGALGRVVEAIRTLFEGDPEMRRQVSFSVAIIALSAKMAKADGLVTEKEVDAFRQIFDFPLEEAQNVARLYNLARQDIAGYEAYATRLSGLCGSGDDNCPMLENVIDGLFHIAKADGLIHEKELAFLARIAEIFKIDEEHFRRILARHVHIEGRDPYLVLGVSPDGSAGRSSARGFWRPTTSARRYSSRPCWKVTTTTARRSRRPFSPMPRPASRRRAPPGR